MGINIIIGGDLFVTPACTTKNLFSKEIVELFGNSDLNIVNMECPIIEGENYDKIQKTGPHLHTNNNIYPLLKQLNIHAVTLANNHILDFGTKGLISTISGCINNGILTVGAGENINSASKSIIIEKEGFKITLVNFCEHEFSIAGKDSAGANPLDIIDNIREIKQAKTFADFVIVIVHGGHEHYNLPSPRMVKQYHFFAENGADAVIGHHTHCISGYEVYNNVPIFYGLGNLLFTMPCNYKGWNNGLLLKIELDKKEPLKWELIPTQQTPDDFRLSLCQEPVRKRILEEILNYSQIIAHEEELLNSWEEYARKMESQVLKDFSPINILPGRYLRSLLIKLGLNKIIFREKYVIPLLNLIECESLHDLSLYILNSKKK